MNQQEKFEARMKTLDPGSIAHILVITDTEGNIIDWAIQKVTRLEGRPKLVEDWNLDVVEVESE